MKKMLVFVLAVSCFLMATAQDGNWDTYLARYQKGPGSTLVNMSLKSTAPDKNYPFLFAAGVKFNNCTPEGLPGPAAFTSLNRVSDSIVNLVNSRTKAILAGTFTYLCERKDYFYVSDTTGLKKAIEELVTRSFIGYSPAFLIKKDWEWDAYLNFLYPNEQTRDFMANQKILMRLQKAGDKPELPRPVEHIISFRRITDRENFIYSVVSQHFSIVSKDSTGLPATPYSVRISRTDRIDLNSVNTLTSGLKELAKKNNGVYEAWETTIMK